MVEPLQFARSWLPKRAKPSELDATMCRLEMRVHNILVSEYQAGVAPKEGYLEIPSYYLAEWIAENWWALLFEPRKNDTANDEQEFLGRHSILAAQHGFPLPALSMVSAGKILHLNVLPRDVPYADMRFTKKAYAFALREEVEHTLTQFVQETVERLNKLEVTGTPLQEAWALVCATQEDEKEFCALMGMLGLSPYDTNPEIESHMEKVEERLGARALRDLALAATEQDFIEAAVEAIQAADKLNEIAPISLVPLSSMHLPEDNLKVQGWQRGVLAAQKIRQHYKVHAQDPHGGKTVFTNLSISVDRRANTLEHGVDENKQLFSAVIAVEDDSARMSLLQTANSRRRFSAARATYLAWISDRQGKIGRFVTHAVTRDQQASRAFAAELLAPIDYIKAQTSGNKLHYQRVFDLATELGVEPGVVSKQAQNNGIMFAAS